MTNKHSFISELQLFVKQKNSVYWKGFVRVPRFHNRQLAELNAFNSKGDSEFDDDLSNKDPSKSQRSFSVHKSMRSKSGTSN